MGTGSKRKTVAKRKVNTFEKLTNRQFAEMVMAECKRRQKDGSDGYEVRAAVCDLKTNHVRSIKLGCLEPLQRAYLAMEDVKHCVRPNGNPFENMF